MKPIGGYFELELKSGNEFHSNAIRLNLSRSAFEYILRAKKIKKVFIPYYTCDVMLERVTMMHIDFEFYTIDKNFEPIFDYKLLKESDYFLYTNYFGIKDIFIKYISKRIRNLIIDNSQSFYSKHIEGNDTIYSPRKFFGVPDGGYLYTDTKLDVDFEQDISMSRFEHLIGRIDLGTENCFELNKNNDILLEGQPIKIMSKITHKLLKSIDYKNIARKRMENFQFMHLVLKDSNKLKIDIDEKAVPMVYPYLIDNGAEMRKKLIKNKIYIATYWPNVLECCNKNQLEYKMANEIIYLPIDQRYSTKDMVRIINIILESQII